MTKSKKRHKHGNASPSVSVLVTATKESSGNGPAVNVEEQSDKCFCDEGSKDIVNSEADIETPKEHSEVPELCPEGDIPKKQSEIASHTLGEEDSFSTQSV